MDKIGKEALDEYSVNITQYIEQKQEIGVTLKNILKNILHKYIYCVDYSVWSGLSIKKHRVTSLFYSWDEKTGKIKTMLGYGSTNFNECQTLTNFFFTFEEALKVRVCLLKNYHQILNTI